MNRRNFFQVVGAVALGGLVAVKPTDDFALRQMSEEEDRAIRLARLAQDHEAQLESIHRKITITTQGSIGINTTPGMSHDDIASAVSQVMADYFNEL